MDSVAFKLWLLNEEVGRLISTFREGQGFDGLKAMEFATDRELARILGVPFKWTAYVTSIGVKYAPRLVRGGYFEDLVTDVVSHLVMDLERNPSLKASIEQAKARSGADEAALLNNLKAVVMQAAKLRFTDFRRRYERQQTRTVQFGQQADDGGARNVADTSPEPGADRDTESLIRAIQGELKAMHDQEIREKKTKLARRLDIALKVLPDRVAGASLDDMAQKHGLNRSQMQSVLNDIKAAFTRATGGYGRTGTEG